MRENTPASALLEFNTKYYDGDEVTETDKRSITEAWLRDTSLDLYIQFASTKIRKLGINLKHNLVVCAKDNKHRRAG